MVATVNAQKIDLKAKWAKQKAKEKKQRLDFGRELKRLALARACDNITNWG
jgi:hypothetical protein